MSFLRLPPELLFLILSHLDSDFFAQDLGRLSVSKQWYSWASQVMVRDLHLTSRMLISFMRDDSLFPPQPGTSGHNQTRLGGFDGLRGFSYRLLRPDDPP